MNTYRSTLAVVLILASAHALAAASSRSFEGTAKDAWITGKIEMAYTLNRHLNPFKIDTDVENGKVMLKGAVESEIDRDLAEQIALGIDGVVAVDNELDVDMKSAKSAAHATDTGGAEHRNFPSWFDDATTTAAVKTILIGNPNTRGMQIDVDTHDDVVTLSGRVGSEEQLELAESLARNASDVRDVRNLLVVDDAQ